MQRLVLALAALTAAAFAPHAEARMPLQCNKKQTRCLTENANLSIGDQVGVFNTDGELVASGEVTGVRGERRSLKIEKRHGKIYKGYTLSLLESEKRMGYSPNASITQYKTYRQPSDITVGASAGLSNVSIGESSPGSELSVYGTSRSIGGMQIVGRGVYTGIEGKVSRYSNDDEVLEVQPISVTGLGALGGIAYILREQQTLSFRGELSAGAMYIIADVGGEKGDVSGAGYNTRLKNGLAPYGRTSVGAMLNFDEWHVTADVAFALVHEAFAKTLALGVVKDLDSAP